MARKTGIEDTGNLTIAKFRHETSRAQEPQLHTHAVIVNMTQRQDGQWRALHNEAIVKSQAYLGNVYKSVLARELEKMGYSLRYDGKTGTFDMAHFSREQIEAFSSRSEQIVNHLREQGLDRETASSAEKDRAALMTRERKEKIDRDVLFDKWQIAAKEAGLDQSFVKGKQAGEGSILQAFKLETMKSHHADEAVKHAVESLTERQAIIRKGQVIDAALRFSFGKLTVGDITEAYKRASGSGGYIVTGAYRYKAINTEDAVQKTRQDWLVFLKDHGKGEEEARKLFENGIKEGRLRLADVQITTRQAVAWEKDILTREKSSRGAVKTGITTQAIDKFLQTKTLSDEQAHAVKAIAQQENRFIGVHGYAGVGKSYMTVSAKELLESQGYHVTSLAPYGSQKKALEAEGIKARTVASFLAAKDRRIGEKSVVFIDEAGVIPARQMQQVMEVIEAHGAKAVFLGDTAQTKAVEAGRPFDQLIAAGMQTTYVSKIQRQKDEVLLQAVQYSAEGKTKESLATIEKDIHEIKNNSERYSRIVKDYAALSKEERDQTLIVTGTNESRHAINGQVREELGLAGKGEKLVTLNRLDTTQAERRWSQFYSVGSIIQQEVGDSRTGLRKGEAYEVVNNGDGKNQLRVKHIHTGEEVTFSPARARQLSVYEKREVELSVGDRVRITRNEHEQNMANGDIFRVTSLGKGRIELEEVGNIRKRVVLASTQPLFVSHAYATTIHSSQGLTSERVLVNIETQSRTTTKEVYYVGISRARHKASIYTNDRQKLPEAIARSTYKTAAMELKKEDRGKEKPQRRVERKREL
ncbi:MobF family relaxase [Entomobacter blattae]